ncbi:hypothetical protein [Macrococcus brunensis]|uniref:hypothetical protein n=1 Tax=Macrococcus brunensis TaxID=198483 RepID=UPI001EF0BF4A|nr:hypothetical protein [Macrococcus brunensis]ULG71912.1 hypothetical protein MGG12_11665 [Macrococcus brunensis]
MVGFTNNETYANHLSFNEKSKDNINNLKYDIANKFVALNQGGPIIKGLKLFEDYDIEIVEVIDNQYKPGLTWEDIKAL